MEDTVSITPMVDILSKLTGRAVVMREETHVYLDTKEEVAEELVAQATTEQSSLIKSATYESALKNINDLYEGEVAKLTKGVPNTEISTWDKQEREAIAYVAYSSASTPLIDNFVLARGVTKEYLVGKIIEKADAYTIAVGVLTGERQRREDELA